MLRTLARTCLAAVLAGAGPALAAAPAQAAPPPLKYKNCAALNKDYKHGVGRKGAKDHVSGSTKPVTDFRVDSVVYTANKAKLDRDKDGIACEKR